jgi:hypothetical protein
MTERPPSGKFEDGITRVRGRVGKVPWPELSAGLPWGILLISGESPEQRAYRRFPVDRHKPGGLDKPNPPRQTPP